MNTSTTYNRPLQDPITRQPFHAEVLAWVTQIDEEGPFKLTTIIPTEHSIVRVVANANYLTLVDTKGNFTLYNKDIEEVVILEVPSHNSVFVTEDGTQAITYNYLSTSIPVGTVTEKVLPKLWTITPEEVTSKDLKTELNPAVKGAFITPGNKFYLYTTGDSFTRWGLTKANNLTKATIVKQKDLYRPDKTYPMQIHYTNNKLIYYTSTNYFVSYVTRNEDNTFSVLCENTSYVPLRYAGNDISPIAFSLDGTLMATYVRHLGKIHIHDISQGEPILLTELPPAITGYHNSSLAFSTDKKYLFVTYSNIILVYNISTTPRLVQKIQVGETPSSRSYIPYIKLAYFNEFVVAAVGKLVYFFKEE